MSTTIENKDLATINGTEATPVINYDDVSNYGVSVPEGYEWAKPSLQQLEPISNTEADIKKSAYTTNRETLDYLLPKVDPEQEKKQKRSMEQTNAVSSLAGGLMALGNVIAANNGATATKIPEYNSFAPDFGDYYKNKLAERNEQRTATANAYKADVAEYQADRKAAAALDKSVNQRRAYAAARNQRVIADLIKDKNKADRAEQEHLWKMDEIREKGKITAQNISQKAVLAKNLVEFRQSIAKNIKDSEMQEWNNTAATKEENWIPIYDSFGNVVARKVPDAATRKAQVAQYKKQTPQKQTTPTPTPTKTDNKQQKKGHINW